MTPIRFSLGLVVVTLAQAATAGMAHAGGFYVPETSARATGRADAVTATDTDGSATFFNPGGLGFAEGAQVEIGASLIVPDASFTEQSTGVTTEMTSDPSVVPSLFAVAKVNRILRVGVGLNIPFGSTVTWPASSPAADVTRAVTLRAVYASPVAGLDLSQWVPGLAVGGGIDLVPAGVELQRDVFFGQDVGTAKLAGTGFGVGARAGLMYRPPALSGLSLGAAYRSPVKIDFSGNGNFDAPSPYRSSLPPDGNVTTSITLPQSVLSGIAYRILPSLELELDLDWTGWSSVDQLDMTLPDGTHSIVPEGYRNTLTWRGGAEYRLRGYGLALRAGYAYDPTPIPRQYLTVQLPDIDRHVVSAGVGYNRLPYDARLDAGVLWVLPGSRRTAGSVEPTEAQGQYDVSAVVVGLGLSVDFGQTRSRGLL